MANNPNAPENLLTPWLITMDDYAMGARVYDKDITGFEKALLAHILEFADQHNKLYEMLLWLGTDEARSYFSSASDYSEAMYTEFEFIDDLSGFDDLDDDPEFVTNYLDEIRGWIHQNRQELPVTLELN